MLHYVSKLSLAGIKDGAPSLLDRIERALHEIAQLDLVERPSVRVAYHLHLPARFRKGDIQDSLTCFNSVK
jgi:hypothetical protein